MLKSSRLSLWRSTLVAVFVCACIPAPTGAQGTADAASVLNAAAGEWAGGRDAGEVRAKLKALDARRRQIQSELTYVTSKASLTEGRIQQIQQKPEAERDAAAQKDLQRCQRELAGWQGRLEKGETELRLIDKEEASLVGTLRTDVTATGAMLAADLGGATADPVRASFQFLRETTLTIDGIKKQLQDLADTRQSIEGERAYFESKVNWAKRKLEGVGVGQEGTETEYQRQRDTWQRELKAWQERLAIDKEQLGRIAAEEDSLRSAMQEVVKTQGGVVLPGETLEVTVLEDDTLNGLYQVRRGGYLVLERLGRLLVVGKKLDEVEALIKKELEAKWLRKATVMVEKPQAVRGPVERKTADILYLADEVTRRGPWRIPQGFTPTIVTTLLRIGLTPFADTTRVRVLRLVEGKGLVEEINVQEIMDGAGLTVDYALLPDDIIIVPPEDTGETPGRVVYIQGEVNSPGIVPLWPPARMTLHVAVLQSGGPTENADLSRVELVRIEQEETVKQTINLNAIIAGEQPDVTLVADDFLIVPGIDLPKRIYFVGRVRQPGIMSVLPHEEFAVYEAIVHRGGFQRFANLKKTYVLRDLGDGVRSRIPVNLKAVKKGILPDLILVDNDIVTVPEKFFSF